jgi:hypothetical protein
MTEPGKFGLGACLTETTTTKSNHAIRYLPIRFSDRISILFQPIKSITHADKKTVKRCYNALRMKIEEENAI